MPFDWLGYLLKWFCASGIFLHLSVKPEFYLISASACGRDALRAPHYFSREEGAFWAYESLRTWLQVQWKCEEKSRLSFSCLPGSHFASVCIMPSVGRKTRSNHYDDKKIILAVSYRNNALLFLQLKDTQCLNFILHSSCVIVSWNLGRSVLWAK